jgi:uncharacterized membrane protein
MRVVSGILWVVVAAFAGLAGVLLISDEPGATAARWYLGFAVLAALMGIGSLVWRGARARRLLALGSVTTLALIALHAFAIVAFAYQGLTILILAPAVFAAGFAAAAWARNRREEGPNRSSS